MNIIEIAKKYNLIKELKDIDIVEDNSIYLNEEKSKKSPRVSHSKIFSLNYINKKRIYQ